MPLFKLILIRSSIKIKECKTKENIVKKLVKKQICKNQILEKYKRRDWDLNPGEGFPHRISSPAPYQTRLSRQKETEKYLEINLNI